MIKRLAIILFFSLVLYLGWWPWYQPLNHRNPTQTSLMQLRAAQARAQGKRLRASLQWRPLSRISPNLVHALLMAEDDTFFTHSGFDAERTLFALREDWKRKRFAFGGSTLTQQLARTLYLTPSKNLLRKLKEAVITVWLERTLSKRRILELYLNVVEWGRGIYGAEAAAQYYFQTSAADLTVDESVALAAILPSPRRWSPFSERAYMLQRRTNILEEMRHQGYIPEDPPPNEDINMD